MISDTICALASSNIAQAISIIRLSGDDAIIVANKVLKKSILNQESHTIIYNHVVENGQILDEVMVSVFKAPKTYTKEDVVEINVHGGRYISKKVVSLLLGNGARLALPGEFTQRAYLNSRIDLTQVEAINSMINASTMYEASKAIKALKGNISTFVLELKQELLDIIANIEVNIDYPEYDDVIQLTSDILLPKCKNWEKRVNKIILDSQKNILINSGISTAIVGKPNVGKSSLLNALLQEDKAIVSNIAGTTRDLVEGEIVVDNIKLKLIDTAGIRNNAQIIEEMGIKKSKEVISRASLVILVLDASCSLEEQDYELLDLLKDKNHIIVENKSDLGSLNMGIPISALNNDIDLLIEKIKIMFDSESLLNNNETLQNERQIGLLMQSRSALQNAINSLDEGLELELAAIDLNMAYQNISDILGEYSRNDLLDSLFSNFCLGK
ncbi:MAG: tRNA uridine-5-carboxymethylaminomethyl(34) synthesis GTPase MnmE [Erysipelotrichaceae bacterium]